jgi:prepilin-type N-terminal cleavage/methylation domain-containing protein
MFLPWKPKINPRSGFTLIEVLIAFVIFTVVIAGLIDGYVQINRTATWCSWSLAAQSIASQGLEQARAAEWDDLGGNDQWPPVTNGLGVAQATIETNSLDVPSNGSLIWVTNYITVSTYSGTPPIRQIRSDCVWTYPMTGQLCTNTVITLRAPDQ